MEVQDFTSRAADAGEADRLGCRGLAKGNFARASVSSHWCLYCFHRLIQLLCVLGSNAQVGGPPKIPLPFLPVRKKPPKRIHASTCISEKNQKNPSPQCHFFVEDKSPYQRISASAEKAIHGNYVIAVAITHSCIVDSRRNGVGRTAGIEHRPDALALQKAMVRAIVWSMSPDCP